MLNNKSEQTYISEHLVKRICITCVAIILITSIAFFWRRDILKFGEGWVLDNELWGTFGDFIGGILGSILAALSFLMMFWTLKAQREISTISNDLSELQRFNSLFFELLGLYHRQVSDLRTSGHSYFMAEMKNMQNDFGEYTTFCIGRRYAKDKYLNFYLENAEKIAPVFRTLYRLFCLIDQANIDNHEKLEYAKTVRAQLSEGELFFLRYNCLTNYGRNFINLINKYRITKHLPFLSLLENTDLRRKVTQVNSQRGLALNSLAYMIGKEIYNRMVTTVDADKRLELLQENVRYRLSILVKPSETVIIQLQISTNRRNNTPALRCLDNLDNDRITKLLYDILREIIIFSNTATYNDYSQIAFSSKQRCVQEKVTLWSYAKARNGYKIRVSHPDWDKEYGITKP